MDWTTFIIDVLISLAMALVPTTLCIIGEVGIGVLLYVIVFIGIIARIVDELTD